MTDKTQQDLPQTSQTESSGFLPAIVRIYWMAFGNAAVVVLAGLIIQKGKFSLLDVLFWTNVLVLVLIRYYDITRLKGLTAECEPATMQHWKRYTVMLLLISLSVWLIAHAVRSIV